MRKWSIFIAVVFVAQMSVGQIQKSELSTYSFYVNKTFVIDDLTKQGTGIKVIVTGKNKSEPAGLPIYITAKIQCGKSNYKKIEMERDFSSRYKGKFNQFMSAKSSQFPYGQIHVCSLENVNFDHEKIFITVLDSGANGCRQDEKIDFIIPIKDLCQ